jgi:hypothetical protein
MCFEHSCIRLVIAESIRVCHSFTCASRTAGCRTEATAVVLVAVVVVHFTNYYSGDQIKEDEVYGLYGTYRGDEEYIWGFGRET